MREPIHPAPVISFPASGIPATRVVHVRAMPPDGEPGEWRPRAIVYRGTGQATRVRIIRPRWASAYV